MFSKTRENQAGQSLIETMVAIFILVMGIVAALGLAIYSLNNSTNISKQIIATGLAREGVEAFKNMRDTNWLATALDTGCYDYASGGNNARCYTRWLTGDPGAPGSKKGFAINPNSGNPPVSCLRVQVQPDTSKDAWVVAEDNCNNGNWGLDKNFSLDIGQFAALYGTANAAQGVKNGSSNFYRKVILTKFSTDPYRSNMEKLLVQSRVWWVDKKCPRVDDWNESQNKLPKEACRLELQMHLTNWKDY